MHLEALVLYLLSPAHCHAPLKLVGTVNPFFTSPGWQWPTLSTSFVPNRPWIVLLMDWQMDGLTDSGDHMSPFNFLGGSNQEVPPHPTKNTDNITQQCANMQHYRDWGRVCTWEKHYFDPSYQHFSPGYSLYDKTHQIKHISDSDSSALSSAPQHPKTSQKVSIAI